MKSILASVALLLVIKFGLAFASALKLGEKFVGGDAVVIEQFPYLVAVLKKGNLNCGGSIISDRWILTAAICIVDTIPRYLTVRVGSSFHQQGGAVHQVDSVHQHPDNKPYRARYDFALLHLETPLNFGVAVQPVPELASDLDFGIDCFVSGWEKNLNDSQSNAQLRAARIRLFSREQCNQHYNEQIDQTMVCAGEIGHDSCQGIAGGPLVCREKQVGILSWANGCGDYLGVYANVASVRYWIKSITGY